MVPKKMYTNDMAHTKQNAIDYDFNHLRIPAAPPGDMPSDPVIIVAVDPPPFKTDAAVRTYVSLLQQKLILARDFILAEHAAGLDPHREMTEDATAIALGEPPIRLIFYTQELIRDIVTLRPRLVDLSKNAEVAVSHEEELNVLLPRFSWHWNELRLVVATLMVGKTQEKKMERAENMMAAVFGENPVADEEEDDVEPSAAENVIEAVEY